MTQAEQVKEHTRANKADLEAQIQREKAEKTFEALQAAERKCKETELELFTSQSHLHSVNIRIGAAEERAENAEEIARRADAELVSMRIATSEKIADAEKKMAEAVTTYKQSDEYTRELADATAFSYDLGFEDCKIKVKQVFGLDGIESLEPDLEDQASPPSENTAPTES